MKAQYAPIDMTNIKTKVPTGSRPGYFPTILRQCSTANITYLRVDAYAVRSAALMESGN